MRKEAKKIKWLYIITLICFMLSALSLVMIPFIARFDEALQPLVGYIVAGVFWGGIVAGVVLTIIICCKIRPIRKYILYNKGKISQIKLPGIIRFRKAPMSIVTYALFAVCVGLIISDLCLKWLPPIAVYSALGAALLAFAAHCIFDGKNFYTYQYMKEGNEK